MADSDAHVIRWELDNVSSITDRRAESDDFEAGGFVWTVLINPHPTIASYIEFSYKCSHQSGEKWSCDAEIDFKLLHNNGEDDFAKGFIDNNTLIFRLRIQILSSNFTEIVKPILDLTKFCSPNEVSNVTLVIGDNKIQVSKDYLAIHSPVFTAMFFKNFAEQDQQEIAIKEVVYEEFIDLLQLIFPVQSKICAAKVHHILALGDRFQMQQVMVAAEDHLLTSRKFKIAEKLHLADQYRLAKLRNHCLNEFPTVQDIATLEATSEYAAFTDAMKAAICDRMMKLANEN